MFLNAPDKAPQVLLHDSKGVPIEVGQGRKMLLSFFRDTNCPFCNVRIFELTQRHEEWQRHGLEVIAFFYSSQEEVDEFLKRRPRPFRIVADPQNIAYKSYGIDRSLSRKLYAVFRRLPIWIAGMRLLGLGGTLRGLGGLNTNNILPADFLVDEEGSLVAVYYGKDPGDHIPLEQIARFVSDQASP